MLLGKKLGKHQPSFSKFIIGKTKSQGGNIGKINDALLNWFTSMRSYNIPIMAQLFQKKESWQGEEVRQSQL